MSEKQNSKSTSTSSSSSLPRIGTPKLAHLHDHPVYSPHNWDHPGRRKSLRDLLTASGGTAVTPAAGSSGSTAKAGPTATASASTATLSADSAPASARAASAVARYFHDEPSHALGTAEMSPASQRREYERLFELMGSYLSIEPEDIEQFIVNHIEYTLARSRFNIDDFAAYSATAYSVRDRLIEFWNDAQQSARDKGLKMVYYMSIEFLLGRSLQNAVTNLGLKDEYSEALKNLGWKLEDLYEREQDAALGNGGLGRLAACFLDSLATLNFPAWGYGLRYQYGMFRQTLHNGYQVETPDYWLGSGNPWEVRRPDKSYTVRYCGQVREVIGTDGKWMVQWEGGQTVQAIAHDMPIPGYGTLNVSNLRLWDSRPSDEFDFESFNVGDYYGAIKAKQESENICSVLYPNDSTPKGRELRLKQQYFFVSASLQDMIRRYLRDNPKRPVSDFHECAAIQLNDTHPSISIAELMRLLLDVYKISWDEAWGCTTKTFAYTNHTVLPEALEKWDVPLFEYLLPRHIQIVYEINRRFLELVATKFPDNPGMLARMSLIEESNPKRIRMAHLAVVGSHSVNGVAAIHTEIIKKTIFPDFYALWPEKFNNKTNGVTPRRWLDQANPGLSALLTNALANDEWITDLDKITRIRKYADNSEFQNRFAAVKLKNKQRLAQLILKLTDGHVDVNPKALFDVQVKRIHEYKRQLLNILGVVHRYLTLRSLTKAQRSQCVPRVVIFGGKAAPGYHRAKLIIKLINSVAATVNSDASTNEWLKVVFLPNYNVSLAEKIIPGSDISQHISTAGTEASGTSNMKFAMNGGIILGTLDGANIEMADEIGHENMFIFGALSTDVDNLRRAPPHSIDARLVAVLKAIQTEELFGSGSQYGEILDPLWQGNDFYLVAHDFASYIETQNKIDSIYSNPFEWNKRAILTTAGMGKFSSDRTIKEYAREIWQVEPTELHDPITNYHS